MNGAGLFPVASNLDPIPTNCRRWVTPCRLAQQNGPGGEPGPRWCDRLAGGQRNGPGSELGPRGSSGAVQSAQPRSSPASRLLRSSNR